jgi:hypothetical protein
MERKLRMATSGGPLSKEKGHRYGVIPDLRATETSPSTKLRVEPRYVEGVKRWQSHLLQLLSRHYKVSGPGRKQALDKLLLKQNLAYTLPRYFE